MFKFITSFPGLVGKEVYSYSAEGKVAFATGHFSPALFVSQEHMEEIFGKSASASFNPLELCRVDAWLREGLPMQADGDLQNGECHPAFLSAHSERLGKSNSSPVVDQAGSYHLEGDVVLLHADVPVVFPKELAEGSLFWYRTQEHEEEKPFKKSFVAGVPALVRTSVAPGLEFDVAGVSATITPDKIVFAEPIDVYGESITAIDLVHLNVFKSVLVSVLAAASRQVRSMV